MHQLVKKKALVFLIAVLLLFNSGYVQAWSYDELSEEEKIRFTASMLADLITRISEQYLWDVSVEDLYEGAVNGMMDTLDEYSQYFTENELDYFLRDVSAQVFGIGVYLRQNDDGSTVIDSTISGEPAETAGIKPGDIVTGVDGVDVTAFDTTKISNMIRERNHNEIEIEILRGSEKLKFNVVKAQISKETAKTAKFEDLLEAAKEKDNSAYGYIIIDQISENTANELENIILKYEEQGVTEVVIDFRGNPGGQLDTAIEICKLLVPEGPLLYTINKEGKKDTYLSELAEAPFENIIVLADRNTASAAEIIIAAMQDAEIAIVVGEKTYGKGVVQTLQSMQLGDAVKFTTMEYYRRSGVKVNDVGIKPNILCYIPDFLSYDDERLHNNGSIDELPKAKEILRYLGYETGELDRLNDELTSEAIRMFQENSGLRQTGVCDYETKIALNSKLRQVLAKDDRVLLEAYKILCN